jgi:hypothetical protein
MQGTHLTIFCGFLVSACVSSQVINEPRTETARKIGTEPLPGITNIVPVGGTIFAEFNYREVATQSQVLSIGLSRPFVLGTIQIPDGEQMKQIRSNSGDEYCTATSTYIDPLAGPYSPTCFRDSNGDGSLDEFRVPPILLGSWSTLSAPLKIDKRVSTSIAPDGGFRKELVFQGIDGRTLRVMYREFSNDLIRPAFSQDLTYPISGTSAEIVFQNVRIEVLETSGVSLKYVVRSGF